MLSNLHRNKKEKNYLENSEEEVYTKVNGIADYFLAFLCQGEKDQNHHCNLFIKLCNLKVVSSMSLNRTILLKK